MVNNLSSMVSYLPSTSKVNVVDSLLQNREATLATLEGKLGNDSTYHMNKKVDRHHSKCFFEEGIQVFLDLQPYKKTSLKAKIHHKCHVQMKLPKLDEEGPLWLQPKVVLDTREC